MANIPFLKRIDLFAGLSEKELALLLPLLQRQVFEEGKFIFHEEDPGEDLYIVQEGEVEILKGDEYHPLAHVGPGEWFGEMAFLGDSTRCASARVIHRAEVWAVPLSKLNALSSQGFEYSKIAENLAKKLSLRIKKLNEGYIVSLQNELERTQAHDQMSQLMIHLFFLFALFFYAFKLMEQYAPSSWIGWVPAVVILSFAISAALLIKKSGYPLSFYGLTLDRWKRHAFQAFLLTIPFLVAMVIVKWILIKTTPAFADFTLFTFGNAKTGFVHPGLHIFIPTAIYVLLVPIQEFIVRGCLQSCLQNFFQSADRVFWAILASNLLFLVFHGFKSFSFALTAFFLGLFWGKLYSMQKSIVGTTLSHALIGVWGLAVLDYQRIFIV